jgi:hypothetical protein
MRLSALLAVPVKPDSLPPHFIGDGVLSLAVGLYCVDCGQQIKRFDVLTCDDAVSFQICCPLCGRTIVCFERRQ